MHIMIDLEALGNPPNGFITSIGAVEFDHNGIYREFFRNIRIKDTEGFNFAAGPTEFWLKQPKEVQEQMMNYIENQDNSLRGVLLDFKKWVESLKNTHLEPTNNPIIMKEVSKPLQGVWGNGATYDNVMLSTAYQIIKIEKPWKFRQDCCFRTMKRVFPLESHEIPLIEGNKHNALVDAKWQAKWLIKICQKYGIKL